MKFDLESLFNIMYDTIQEHLEKYSETTLYYLDEDRFNIDNFDYIFDNKITLSNIDDTIISTDKNSWHSIDKSNIYIIDNIFSGNIGVCSITNKKYFKSIYWEIKEDFRKKCDEIWRTISPYSISEIISIKSERKRKKINAIHDPIWNRGFIVTSFLAHLEKENEDYFDNIIIDFIEKYKKYLFDKI